MATSSPAQTTTYLSSPGAQVYAGSPSDATECRTPSTAPDQTRPAVQLSSRPGDRRPGGSWRGRVRRDDGPGGPVPTRSGRLSPHRSRRPGVGCHVVQGASTRRARGKRSRPVRAVGCPTVSWERPSSSYKRNMRAAVITTNLRTKIRIMPGPANCSLWRSELFSLVKLHLSRVPPADQECAGTNAQRVQTQRLARARKG